MPASVVSLQGVPAEPGVSRYAALAQALRARIVAGEWPPATALPSEAVLAREHGVALGTLRRALALLAEQGLVDRRHGLGTFVRSGLAGAPMLRFFRFGGEPGEVPASRIVSRRTLSAPADIARRLDLGPGVPALRIGRVRSVGGRPCLVEDIWLPLPRFASLQSGPTAAWGDLLYPLFARACDVHVARAVDEIGFGTLAADPARALGLPPGHPCAVVSRRAFDLAGRPVEWRVTRGDAHAFAYTVTLT